MSIHILLADDHIIITDWLKSLISKMLPDARIAQVDNMPAALDYLQHTDVQLIVCDINMRGANHIGIVKMIRAIRPRTKLLILTGYSTRLYARRYLQEGADAYLSKDVAPERIEETVLALLQGATGLVIDEESTQSRPEMSPFKLLSNRELEVAQLLVQGNGILEISNLLNLHVNTVSTYKARVFDKLSVLSIPELVEVFRHYADETDW